MGMGKFDFLFFDFYLKWGFGFNLFVFASYAIKYHGTKKWC